LFFLIDDAFRFFRGKKKVGLLGNKERRKIVIEKIKTFMYEEDGLTIVEYAVAAGLITALVAGAFTALGVSVENVITTVTGYLPAP
jgi:pilus assembly protein Flp/PilA